MSSAKRTGALAIASKASLHVPSEANWCAPAPKRDDALFECVKVLARGVALSTLWAGAVGGVHCSHLKRTHVHAELGTVALHM